MPRKANKLVSNSKENQIKVTAPPTDRPTAQSTSNKVMIAPK